VSDKLDSGIENHSVILAPRRVFRTPGVRSEDQHPLT